MRPAFLTAMVCLLASTASAEIYDSAVEGLFAPYLSGEEQSLELEGFPSYIRPSLFELVEAYNEYSPQDSPEDPVRAGLLRAFAVLARDSAARPRALAYLDSAPVSGDWEGMPEGPMAEAVAAVTWLREHPESPLEPFLLLLAAHRARAAWECYASLYYPEAEEPVYASGMQTTAEIYNVMLGEALVHSDPAVQWLAGELDDLPWVYMNVRDIVPEDRRAGP